MSSSFDFGNNKPKEEQLSLGLSTEGERYTPPAHKMISELLKHYKEVGFPYIKLTDEEKQAEFTSLVNFSKPLINGDIVTADSTGVALANSYHPHRYEVPVNDNRTAMFVFKREWYLEKCLEKCVKMSGKVTDASLRSMISIFEGVQVPSNFPPATAKEIYEYFLPNSGVTWDMSCGWGGRLLAALSSKAVTKYQGTEPSTKTFHGLLNMARYLHSLGNAQQSPVLISQQGSEQTLPTSWESVDLCFTSPPYFNTEKYSPESTQSYLSYPTQRQWMEGFICNTLRNCLEVMKESAFLVVNIANCKNYQYLTKDFLKTADSVGFKLITTKSLELSTMPGAGKRNKSENKSGSRTEPIFVMVKK